MIRIFFTLATLSLVLLVSQMILGLTMGDLHAKPEPSRLTQQLATIHRLAGVAAALAVVFVECIVVTYFIGTSRWCKEVVDTYKMDRAPIATSNLLKRKTFPWALGGMLVVVAIGALGAAADPATIRPNTEAWVQWHLLAAFLGIVFVVWTYFIEWNNIVANHALIEQVVAEVARIRQDRGLDEVRPNDHFSGAAG